MSDITITWQGETPYAAAPKGFRFISGEHVESLGDTKGKDLLDLVAKLETERCSCSACEPVIVSAEKVRELMRAYRINAVRLAERMGVKTSQAVTWRQSGITNSQTAVRFVKAVKETL